MIKKLLVGLASVATAASAFATGVAGNTVYSYTGTASNAAPGGTLAQQYAGLNLTYNPALNSLRITSSFTSGQVDGYWLALSPGANPKGNSTELAILYMDLKENRYAVYNYNGVNGSNSYNTGGAGSSPVFIQGGAANLTQVGNSYTFNLNVNAINNGALNSNAGWTGMEFGNQIGLWYHFFDGDVVFNNNGTVQALHAYSQGWSDLANQRTTANCTNTGGTPSNGCCPTGTTPGTGGSCCPTGGSSSGGAGCGSSSSSSGQVPLPGSVFLMGLGLLALGLLGRRKQA
jgi:PEP-CTERM motif